MVRYNSLTTTNASADVLFNRLVDYDARQGQSSAQPGQRLESGAGWPVGHLLAA